MSVRARRGRAAVTRYEVVERFRGATAAAPRAGDRPHPPDPCAPRRARSPHRRRSSLRRAGGVRSGATAAVAGGLSAPGAACRIALPSRIRRPGAPVVVRSPLPADLETPARVRSVASGRLDTPRRFPYLRRRGRGSARIPPIATRLPVTPVRIYRRFPALGRTHPSMRSSILAAREDARREHARARQPATPLRARAAKVAVRPVTERRVRRCRATSRRRPSPRRTCRR